MSDEPSVARYVRIRREFAVQALFSSVQYSFSNDGQNMVETLVLHVRDPKDLIQVSMEDSASAIGSAETMVAANTPASRIRLERFGKSSIALARCAGIRERSRAGSERLRAAIPQRLRSAGQLSQPAWRAAHWCPRNWRRSPARSRKTAKPKSASQRKPVGREEMRIYSVHSVSSVVKILRSSVLASTAAASKSEIRNLTAIKS